MGESLNLQVREERRRRHLQRKTGLSHPMCLRCGYDDPFDLIVDHTSGRGYGPELGVLCTRCHSRRNAEQVDHPTRPLDADTHTRDIAWAQRFVQSWLETFEAAAPNLGRALDMMQNVAPLHLDLMQPPQQRRVEHPNGDLPPLVMPVFPPMEIGDVSGR
jgi:hypothetical protein